MVILWQLCSGIIPAWENSKRLKRSKKQTNNGWFPQLPSLSPTKKMHPAVLAAQCFSAFSARWTGPAFLLL